MIAPYRYRHHGLRLASSIELPELECRRLPADEPASDVTISLGPVDRPDAAPGGPPAVDGSALLSYTNLGRILVTQGRAIIADLRPDADPALVSSCLLTVAIPAICHQRGLMVLHASAVAFGERVVAFAGDSGAGKSTMAAHCLEAGARLIADDILVASPGPDGTFLAYPGTSQLKLKSYALQSLGRTSEGLVQQDPDEDKFLVPSLERLAPSPLPFVRVHILQEDDTAGSGRYEKLSGAGLISALVNNCFGERHLDIVGARSTHFAACCALAEKVEVVRLARRRDPALLPQTAAMIKRIATAEVAT